MHNVFVYGSLKKGYGNHLLLEKSEQIAAVASTVDKFSLYDGGFPYMLRNGEDYVLGEVYSVDDDTLRRLDQLEGTPNFYERIASMVHYGENHEEIMPCYMYVASKRTEPHVIAHHKKIEDSDHVVEWVKVFRRV